MSDTPRCAKLFTNHCGVDPVDATGCLLDCHHSGPHEFIAENGKRYRWEVDMDCDCESCRADEPIDWCLIYGEVE